jgi:predicted nucleic acid-binding protein
LIATLLEDERVEFAPEPPRLDSYLPALWKYPVPTGKLVTDAYLIAFALCLSCRLVTLDRGFREFSEVPVVLL